MACFSAGNAFLNNNSFVAATISHSSTGKIPMSGLVSGKPLLVLSCDRRESYSSLVVKLREWKTTLQRDDVVAEWKKVRDGMSLHVHCYVSGPNPLQELAAEFRYHIFSKELPLVLNAVVYGDSALFNQHPELMQAIVYVYFHSNSKKCNRVECWGPLKDASQRTFHSRSDGLQDAVLERIGKWANPGTILNAFFAFLL